MTSMQLQKMTPYVNVVFELPDISQYGLGSQSYTTNISNYLFGNVSEIDVTKNFKLFNSR